MSRNMRKQIPLVAIQIRPYCSAVLLLLFKKIDERNPVEKNGTEVEVDWHCTLTPAYCL